MSCSAPSKKRRQRPPRKRHKQELKSNNMIPLNNSNQNTSLVIKNQSSVIQQNPNHRNKSGNKHKKMCMYSLPKRRKRPKMLRDVKPRTRQKTHTSHHSKHGRHCSHSTSSSKGSECFDLVLPVRDRDHELNKIHVCYGEQEKRCTGLKQKDNTCTLTRHWQSACELHHLCHK